MKLTSFLDAQHSMYEEDLLLEFTMENIVSVQEGKQVKVKGRVEGQKTTAKGSTYLNFGAKYPNHVFSCVLRAKDFPSAPPSFEGKEVEVTGVIKMYEGKPSMDISSLEQIHVIEEAPVTAPESKPSEPAS